MKKLILLDAGHGCNTAGKRSPDGKLLEWAYAREIKKMLREKLELNGYEVVDICPESNDVSINTRVQRANSMAKKHPEGSLLISIHSNANGDGKEWVTANGWEVFVAMNASSNSKRLATELARYAAEKGLKVRRAVKDIPFKTKNLGICRDTTMPAVLVENFFHDNKLDVQYAMTEAGKHTFVDVMYDGIVAYLK